MIYDDLTKVVSGALRSCIDAHGAIDPTWIGSATKRVVHALLARELELSKVIGEFDSADALVKFLNERAAARPEERTALELEAWREHGKALGFKAGRIGTSWGVFQDDDSTMNSERS